MWGEVFLSEMNILVVGRRGFLIGMAGVYEWKTGGLWWNVVGG